MEDANFRIFNESDEDTDIYFEYKNYITNNIIFPLKTNFLLYVIEKGDNPYIYYLMNKINDIITLPTLYIKNIQQAYEFMKNKFEKSKYQYKGCIEHNNENYLLFEMNLFDSGMIPIYNKDSWWKVLPFEIIYSKKVLNYKMDQLCSSFFMNKLNLLYLFNKTHKYEVPIVAYIGTGISLLNNHIILEEHIKTGKYGKGFYFSSFEESYFNALYDDLEPTDTLLKLLNNNYITELTPISNRNIIIKNNKFYLNNLFIGDIPNNCNGIFTLHNYTEDFIYLKSNTSLKKCKNKRKYYIKRKEDGCILKYILFLKNSKLVINNKKGKFNSYCSGKIDNKWFPTYMIKDSTNSKCITYHLIDKENIIDIEFMDKKNKHIPEINIK